MKVLSLLFLVLFLFLPCLLPFVSGASYWPLTCVYPYDVFDRLRSSLHREVKGQPLAVESVISLIEDHIQRMRVATPFAVSTTQPHSSLSGQSTVPSTTFQSNKPLVLSFHGWTGTGKSFVRTLISNALFPPSISQSKHGFTSLIPNPHVHIFHGADYAPSSRNRLEHQIDELNYKLKSAIDGCPLSLFIFEEIHLMAAAMMDNLKKFMDTHAIIENRYNFNNAIFLLTSNYGSAALFDLAIQAQMRGIHRENIEYSTIRQLLKEALQATAKIVQTTGKRLEDEDETLDEKRFEQARLAANDRLDANDRSEDGKTDKSGSSLSTSAPANDKSTEDSYTILNNPLLVLVRSAIVDKFIPFFPLFKFHVKECAESQLQDYAARLENSGQLGALHWTKSVLDYVAQQLEYAEMVAIHGCKQVSEVLATKIFPIVERRLTFEESFSYRQMVVDFVMFRDAAGKRRRYKHERDILLLEIKQSAIASSAASSSASASAISSGDPKNSSGRSIVSANLAPITSGNSRYVLLLWLSHHLPSSVTDLDESNLFEHSFHRNDDGVEHVFQEFGKKLISWNIFKKEEWDRLAVSSHQDQFTRRGNLHEL